MEGIPDARNEAVAPRERRAASAAEVRITPERERTAAGKRVDPVTMGAQHIGAREKVLKTTFASSRDRGPQKRPLLDRLTIWAGGLLSAFLLVLAAQISKAHAWEALGGFFAMLAADAWAKIVAALGAMTAKAGALGYAGMVGLGLTAKIVIGIIVAVAIVYYGIKLVRAALRWMRRDGGGSGGLPPHGGRTDNAGYGKDDMGVVLDY